MHKFRYLDRVPEHRSLSQLAKHIFMQTVSLSEIPRHLQRMPEGFRLVLVLQAEIQMFRVIYHPKPKPSEAPTEIRPSSHTRLHRYHPAGLVMCAKKSEFFR
jgi:hypothetical protein